MIPGSSHREIITRIYFAYKKFLNGNCQSVTIMLVLTHLTQQHAYSFVLYRELRPTRLDASFISSTVTIVDVSEYKSYRDIFLFLFAIKLAILFWFKKKK